jgi:hypothetical protein
MYVLNKPPHVLASKFRSGFIGDIVGFMSSELCMMWRDTVSGN